MYLGQEYTEQQINEMDCTNINTLLNRYESVLSAQMTKSLGKSIINLYSNIACSVLGVGNQQGLTKYRFRKRSTPQHCSAKIHMRFVLSLWDFVSSCKHWYNYR